MAIAGRIAARAGARRWPAGRARARSSRCSRAGATRSACSTSRSRCAARRSVRALHVNYGLRPAATDDERHCARYAQELGVELDGRPRRRHAERSRGQPPGLGARAALREAIARARELWRARWRTGHTASDQVETILYRLAPRRGGGRCWAWPRARARSCRPLLGVTREQTAGYCRAAGLAWREDDSNDSERFARARVRHGLAAGAARRPSGGRGQRAAHRRAAARGDGAARRARVRGARRAAGISLARLRELPAALARLVVVRLAEQAAGTYVPQAGERVQEILELGARGGRGELHVGGRACAVIAGRRADHGPSLPPRGH